MSEGLDWEDYKKTWNLSDETKEAVRMETELLEAVIRAREEKGISQRELAELCGMKQPIIARLEKSLHSPQVDTLLRVLHPLGYTLAIVPRSEDSAAS